MAPIVLAVEPRFRAAILTVPGLVHNMLPEVQPIHYAPRVTVPVLMINGRYDYFFPLETSQRPFFEHLGTPAEHKRHVITASGHSVPRDVLVSHSLEWLDRYLGPVEVGTIRSGHSTSAARAESG